MDQQHINTGMHPPGLRMRTAFALTLACGMTLVSAAGHANADAAGAARHAGHAMPAATKPPATMVPPSASITYRRFTFDEPLANWREVNDTVRSIGGWRAYLKEVQDAQAQEKAASAAGRGDARPADKPNKDKP